MAGNEVVPGQEIYEYRGRISTSTPAQCNAVVNGRQQQILGVTGQVLGALQGSTNPVVVNSNQVVWKPHGEPDHEGTFPYPADTDRQIMAGAHVARSAIQITHRMAHPQDSWQLDYTQRGGIGGPRFVTDAVDMLVQSASPYAGDLVGRPMTENQAFVATHVDPSKRRFQLDRPGLNQPLRRSYEAAVIAATGLLTDGSDT